ncbi:ensconsin-like [Engraulis encrasicolus]|uniref:ensconsin-like n=1 Tax=Engraulis encrasicolus TaxID=184585 RepID=UPI002FD37DCE
MLRIRRALFHNVRIVEICLQFWVTDVARDASETLFPTTESGRVRGPGVIGRRQAALVYAGASGDNGLTASSEADEAKWLLNAAEAAMDEEERRRLQAYLLQMAQQAQDVHLQATLLRMTTTEEKHASLLLAAAEAAREEEERRRLQACLLQMAQQAQEVHHQASLLRMTTTQRSANTQAQKEREDKEREKAEKQRAKEEKREAERQRRRVWRQRRASCCSCILLSCFRRPATAD